MISFPARRRGNRNSSWPRNPTRDVSSSAGSFPRQHGSDHRRLAASGIIPALFLVAAAAGGLAAWNSGHHRSRQAEESGATALVRRGPLEVCIVERGELSSANNLTLRCQVEGGSAGTLLKLVNEGSWVEEGEVVAVLDSSQYEEAATLQQIRCITADALLKTAEGKAAIQKLVNENNIAAAELKLQLAQLDLEKYLDGEFVQQSKQIEGDIRLARENLEAAIQQLNHTEQLLRKGYASTKQFDADKVGVTKAQLAFDLATEKLKILQQFSHRRNFTEKSTLAENAARDLDRAKLQADRALAQCNVEVLARNRLQTIESNRMKRIQRQIAACVIRAPRSGIAIHANNPDGTRSSTTPLVYEGVTLREGQPVIELPDLDNMQVRARIHESKILSVRKGLPVTIHLDAHADNVFHGIVEYVSLMPQSAGFPNYNLKEYPAVIRVTDPSYSLKPGMTAQVRILVERLESVLQVPLQACVERGGRYFAWLMTADRSVDRREVKIGRSSDSAVEIIDGLCEGEEVVCNPRTRLPEAVAQLEQEVPEQARPTFIDPTFADPARIRQRTARRRHRHRWFAG
jgi:HlyD family secretion protein